MTATPGSAALLALADRLDASLLGNAVRADVQMASDIIRRLAAKPDEDGVREALESDYLKAICNAGERCSCADKNWQWRDAHCDIAMAHVKAIVTRALSTTGHPKP